MIGAERSRVFPLRIDRSIAFADRDPSIFASRNSRALIRFLEPWNNVRGFRSMPGVCLVAVRKRAVKWILPGREFYRGVIAPVAGIGVVKTAVVFSSNFCPRNSRDSGLDYFRLVARRSKR